MGPWSNAEDPERPRKAPKGDKEVAAKESVETIVSPNKLKKEDAFLKS